MHILFLTWKYLFNTKEESKRGQRHQKRYEIYPKQIPGTPHPHPSQSLRQAAQVLVACVLPPTKPPLAMQAPVGCEPSPSKASFGHAGPSGLCHAHGSLHPRWLTLAHMLQASFRSRSWWEEHTQRWVRQSRSRDLPRGLAGPPGESGVDCSSLWVQGQ